MPKPKNKPAVELKIRRQWLRRSEEDGETPPQIAKVDDYDVRTVRKGIEVARQEREKREARLTVFRNALEEHNNDLVSFAGKIDEEVSRFSISSSTKLDRLYRALRQHTPRSPLWKAIDRLDDMSGDIITLRRLLEEKLHAKVDTEMLGLEKTKIFPDSITGVLLHRLEIPKEELLPALERNLVTEGETEIRYGPWNCAVGPNVQIPAVEKFVSDLITQASESPESANMRQLLDQRRKVIETIREELATIKLRRLVPGQCKYCPI